MKPVSWTWATFDFWRMKIPHLCLWSPSVLPRPSEWDSDVAIAGYTFGHEPSFQPHKSLETFLETDQPVLAVSFGSAIIPDTAKLMSAVFSAVEKIGAKGVVCLSRSKIGTLAIPDHIYLVDQVPHGWLLPRVQGFVHHGGAGHTAIGLKSGVPMLIIPFFLDQNFWAAKIQDLQLGPPALDYHTLTTQTLVSSMRDLLSHKYERRCAELAAQIGSEQDGAEVAAETVVRLQTSTKEQASCDVISDMKASWKHIDSGLHLSGAAAACLTSRNMLRWSDLDAELGVDWDERRSSVSTRWVNTLSKLTDTLYGLIVLVYVMLQWLVAPWATSATEDDKAIKMRDPVRQARIAQGEYDLRYIVERATEIEDGESIEDRIVTNWQVLSTARFHAKFTNGLENGHV